MNQEAICGDNLAGNYWFDLGVMPVFGKRFDNWIMIWCRIRLIMYNWLTNELANQLTRQLTNEETI
jgi:hypothetical protein